MIKPYFEIDAGVVYHGDALSVLRKLPAESVHCVTTSPPYWGLRDYGVDGQLGLEKTPEEYVEKMVEIFREVRRVLRSDGTLWLNMGDSYCGGGRGGGFPESTDGRNNLKPSPIPPGLKPKDLCGIPWRVAFALRKDGWWLRSAMPWVKRSAMPESVTDRPASALEYMFLLTKNSKYYFDMEAIRVKSGDNTHSKGNKLYPPIEDAGIGHKDWHKTTKDILPTRNFRNTDLFYQSIEPPHGMIFCGDEMVGIDVNPKAMKEAHFATFPPKLIEPCILAGTSERGACPECGSPWERVVESTPLHVDAKDSGNRKDLHGPTYTRHKTSIPGGQSLVGQTNKTIGWKQNCTCNEGYHDGKGHISDNVKLEPKPCTVLDIFGGSLTTAIVAYKHNRKFIMIELSETYIRDIGIPRIEKETRQLKLWR